MTSRERILLEMVQDCRRSFLWIQQTGESIELIRSYAGKQAAKIKQETFIFAYGSNSGTIREKLGR